MSPASPAVVKVCTRCGATYGVDAAFCAQDGSGLKVVGNEDPYIGVIVHGDIELRALAGEGAMGRVYRGYQRGTDRDVAVKILHRELTNRQELVQRFLREAKVAGKLHHPHVVEVYATATLPDDAMCIVMEFLDGTSLHAALAAAGGRLPLPRALGIALQIAYAVGEGHGLGIIHRDLKPENVYLVPRGDTPDWVKVLDFGIARSPLPDESTRTAAGAVYGTARYISPEGAQGLEVTPASDVYSLTVMLFEMLAGRTPFEAENGMGFLMQHVHVSPTPLRSLLGSAEVPEAVNQLVMDNLAKDPKGRAADGRALAAAIVRAAESSGVQLPSAGFARSSQVTPPPVVPIAALPIALTLDDAPPVPRVERVEPPERGKAPPRRSSAWILVTILAFVLGGAGVGGVLQYLHRKDSERLAYLERTRAALNEGHYVEPPGESVRDLVSAGLQRWPRDSELAKLRSDAEHEMVTMAMAARTSGDVMGARNLARDAYSLDPTDNSVRIIKAQSEDDLRGITSGATLNSGPPRIVFESPPSAKPGQRIEMTCRIAPGAAGAKANVAGVKASLFPNGQTTDGTPITVTRADTWNVKATFTAPGPGSYDVSFEVSVDGVIVRAMRDLDVSP